MFELIWKISLLILFVASFSIFCWTFGYSLMMPLLVLLLGGHLHYVKKADIKLFSQVGLILFLVILASHAVLHSSITLPLHIPVAGVAMLTMLLFNDLQVTFMMAFAGSLMASMILGGGFEMMLIFFVGSLAGSYGVRDARRRSQLISGGLLVSVSQVTCLLLLNPHLDFILTNNFLAQYLYPLVLNGVISAFFVMTTLKIFESLFGVLTNFSLLELSDFNQPLLKRMVLEAPGSYQHSLVVSNLSEAAADAIGANALLARVGAYYHDIGKMVKPEYYVENQLMGINKHDTMEPSISRLVVLNHVKEGMELARKYKLNQKIIDFIPQHHGTSVMYYFYQKSLEGAEEGKSMEEENFRYPGPKPQIPETAIVLLADSAEGATRALEDPTPNKIEETVKKIVNNKFIDGQLDECHLTLKEIDKISSTFIRILSAMYHARVKYPEKKNGAPRVLKSWPSSSSPEAPRSKERSILKDGPSDQESSEQNPPQPSSDQENSPGHSSS
ncbi:MAG: hypothetical protein A2Z81_00170 [Omnitrophica WOR_2 bacterium GWA2_45_18]|nr:MAG: hypothetical protein A2Z81_00170 [Omnitrophica WOR_2 bacterium GWA2_45_18]